MINRMSGILLALSVGASLAHAQTMRSYSAARQVHGETQLAATVELTAGSLRLAPGGASTLYHLEVIYDSDRFNPQSTYLAVTGEVTLGLQSIGGTGLKVSTAKDLNQAANVVLSPMVDLVLEAKLDAVNAELELGGFRLIGFRISNEASKTVARFSRPNQVRCTRGTFRTGAAEFKVTGLGNSRCDVIAFDGGIGTAELEFSGSWTNDMRLEASMAAGRLVLKLPRGLGVRMTTDNFLAILHPNGFVKTDDAYLSENYQQADRHLEIALKTSLGQVTVEWID
jgi:hypothetical protein